MKRPNKYSKPLGGIRTENYHPADYTNNQYVDDLNKYIDFLESNVKNININLDDLQEGDYICDQSCPYWGYQCNINRMFEDCKKI